MEERQTKKFGKRRTHAQRLVPTKHLEQLTKKARALAGEADPEDVSLLSISRKLANLQRVHSQLQESLVSGSEQLMAARLRQEIGDAQAECSMVEELTEEEFDDGVITDICRELMYHRGKSTKDQEEPARKMYCIENKTICGLKEGQIGVQYDTLYTGKRVESFYLVLGGQPFSESLSVCTHTLPFFLPLKDVEADYLASSASMFINVIGDLLQAYVSRREQIKMFKESKSDKIKHFSHNVLYTAIDFMVEESECKVTFKLGFEDLHCDLPTQTMVLVWPPAPFRKKFMTSLAEEPKPTATPISLLFAEKILQQELLPQAYVRVVNGLNTILAGGSTMDPAAAPLGES